MGSTSFLFCSHFLAESLVVVHTLIRDVNIVGELLVRVRDSAEHTYARSDLVGLVGGGVVPVEEVVDISRV